MSSNVTEFVGSWKDLYVLFMTVLLLLTFVILLWYNCTRRNSSITARRYTPSFRLHTITVVAGDPNYNPPQLGVDEATLKTYPVLLYSEAKRHREADSATTCSICLQDFKNSEWLRELPHCGHLFHRKCVDVWLRMNSSCPLCRKSSLLTPHSTPTAEVAPVAVLAGACL